MSDGDEERILEQLLDQAELRYRYIISDRVGVVTNPTNV
jgi:hypothetical protein